MEQEESRMDWEAWRSAFPHVPDEALDDALEQVRRDAADPLVLQNVATFLSEAWERRQESDDFQYEGVFQPSGLCRYEVTVGGQKLSHDVPSGLATAVGMALYHVAAMHFSRLVQQDG
jgi:hypothetical protein